MGLKARVALAFIVARPRLNDLFKKLLFLAPRRADRDRRARTWTNSVVYSPTSTSFAVLAAASPSALPLFNGFVPEWSIFQAVLQFRELLRMAR